MDHADVAIVPVRQRYRTAELATGGSDPRIEHQIVVVPKFGLGVYLLEVFEQCRRSEAFVGFALHLLYVRRGTEVVSLRMRR